MSKYIFVYYQRKIYYFHLQQASWQAGHFNLDQYDEECKTQYCLILLQIPPMNVSLFQKPQRLSYSSAAVKRHHDQGSSSKSMLSFTLFLVTPEEKLPLCGAAIYSCRAFRKGCLTRVLPCKDTCGQPHIWLFLLFYLHNTRHSWLLCEKEELAE